ncbi:MAG: hemerythrin domain-containing protein [Chloroflexi bacterium]|nr:hemerythrin domain-containing protein [Chloroflexota bacterium]
MASFCPGSRNFREPTPEEMPCPQCGYQVEIWTKELVRPCPRCGTKVFREQRPSCIDWCPYAKECVGPEVYAALRPRATEAKGPLEALRREHEEAQRQLGLLRGATLCLRAAASGGSQAQETSLQGQRTLEKALGFLEGDLASHFRREEEGLFPLLEQKVGKEGPIANMLQEHREMRCGVEELRGLASRLSQDRTLAPEVDRVAGSLIKLLQGHIDKESTALLPLAQAALGEKGLAELSAHWASLEPVIN